jgi:hypothetical protein
VTDEGDSESQAGASTSVPGGSDAGEVQSIETDSATLRSEVAQRRWLRLGGLAVALTGVAVSVTVAILASFIGSNQGQISRITDLLGLGAGIFVLGAGATGLFERAERAIEPKLAHLAADDIWAEIWKKHSEGRSPI